MSNSSHPFNRIHHINPVFNRIFSIPIYVGAVLVTVVFFFSPYWLRIGLSFLINIFFNRPLVYLNYGARFIAKPINRAVMSIFYFLGVGIYALSLRMVRRFRPPRAGDSMWVKSQDASQLNDLYYQS